MSQFLTEDNLMILLILTKEKAFATDTPPSDIDMYLDVMVNLVHELGTLRERK
ncbi:MAG: hypothetical protein UT69_C0037G0011 [Candidatus Yanofskybacteria bacterium GW2011_GWE1_40_10]|nr:MAG: hypothetical protein UT69_C0037G0011 [Candidatus Yanofskybacteria bacterium GW2011_GWE1_40_10]